MSNYKEGEGVVTIAPAPFTSYHLKLDETYLVVVLAGTDVIESSRVKVVLPGSAILPEEMVIYTYPNNWFRLSSRSRLFFNNYSEFHDVLIKDLDGRTLAVLTNVEVTRE